MKKENDWKLWKQLQGITLQTHEQYPEIALLTLNRPEKLNAVDAHMITGIGECLDLLKRSFDCRILMVAGESSDYEEAIKAFFEKRTPKYETR